MDSVQVQSPGPVPAAASAGSRRPLVSILVVNFNGAALLEGCLASLARLSYPNTEVILVDNASTDNSMEVAGKFPWARIVRSATNLGFAGGNNLGLRHCSGEFVLLLNNDTVVAPDFLEPLCDHLLEHAKVGVVQGKKVLPRFGNVLDVCGSFFTAFGLPYHYGYFKPDGPKYQHPYPVFSAKGACLLIRRELVPRIGGFLFDEKFFCYYEESDLCHRTWLAGYEVHFVPGPPIQHLMGATSRRFIANDRIQYYYVRNMLFSLLGNLSVAWACRVLPLFLLVLGLRMGAFLLTLNFSAFRAHAAALLQNIGRWKRIGERRKLVRAMRRVPDGQIFRKCLRTPRLDYFIKTFQGDIGAYVDQSSTES